MELTAIMPPATDGVRATHAWLRSSAHTGSVSHLGEVSGLTRVRGSGDAEKSAPTAMVCQVASPRSATNLPRLWSLVLLPLILPTSATLVVRVRLPS
jgi:hypothetical protein